MKRRLGKNIAFTAALVLSVILLSKSADTYAEESNISSCGELNFKNGEAVIYAEDILYLQGELNELFNEIAD